MLAAGLRLSLLQTNAWLTRFVEIFENWPQP